MTVPPLTVEYPDPPGWDAGMQDEPERALIDREKLDDDYPTQLHSPEFWEHLGRAVATFGFLEEVLKRATLALTATRASPAETVEREFEKGFAGLGGTLTGRLWRPAGWPSALGPRPWPRPGSLLHFADLHPKSTHRNRMFSTESVAELLKAM